MKVVLFCGGLGLRMRDAAQEIPKPMIRIGGSPILLQMMKYYAHFGHTSFILCLGYKSEVIKEYFRTCDDGLYLETQASEHVSSGIFVIDNANWHITFVNTGLAASIGERLLAVRDLVEGEEWFLANYSDVLTDAPLPTMIDNLRAQHKTASLLSVRPTNTSHVVECKQDGQTVSNFLDLRAQDLWINGGYFVFRSDIYDYLEPGEDLVEAPFWRLIRDEQLLAYQYEGFWVPMDTFKDRELIQRLYDDGCRPWAVWESDPRAAAVAVAS